MVHLPPRLYELIGVLVAAYGVFHLVWSSRYQGSERVSHRVRGGLFLLLGAWLIATGLGFRPFGHGDDASAPPSHSAS